MLLLGFREWNILFFILNVANRTVRCAKVVLCRNARTFGDSALQASYRRSARSPGAVFTISAAPGRPPEACSLGSGLVSDVGFRIAVFALSGFSVLLTVLALFMH